MDDFMRELSSMLGFEFRRYAMSYRDGMQDLVDEKNIKVRIELLLLCCNREEWSCLSCFLLSPLFELHEDAHLTLS